MRLCLRDRSTDVKVGEEPFWFKLTKNFTKLIKDLYTAICNEVKGDVGGSAVRL